MRALLCRLGVGHRLNAHRFNGKEIREMNVATILKLKGRSVSTARPDCSLLEVASKLHAKRIGAIVVVGDNGQVAGIISERDVIRAIAEGVVNNSSDCLASPSCGEKSSVIT